MIRTLAWFALWTALSFGIWLLSLSSLSDEELAIGAASAVVCGIAAVTFQRVIGLRGTLGAVEWAAFPTMLAAIVSDSAQVLTRPVRGVRPGTVDVVDLGAHGRGAVATTRRVVATLVMSASPGTVVLDADDDGRITFHSLGCAGPRVEDKVRRR
jgi:multisubunit Na+/H+ antiporter MnhE subunit